MKSRFSISKWLQLRGSVQKGYSPVHNVRPGTKYPATMVTTGDHDDRVVPAHSFKFAAELQAKQAADNPVIIRSETDAGHGAGTPVSKQIEQAADMFGFTLYNMGFNPGIKDGLAWIVEAVEYLTSQNNMFQYTKIHKVLGEGNFVLTVSEGQWNGTANVFYDLLRFEDGKAAEHWDVIQPIPTAGLANDNRMFGF